MEEGRHTVCRVTGLVNRLCKLLLSCNENAKECLNGGSSTASVLRQIACIGDLIVDIRSILDRIGRCRTGAFVNQCIQHAATTIGYDALTIGYDALTIGRVLAHISSSLDILTIVKSAENVVRAEKNSQVFPLDDAMVLVKAVVQYCE